MLKFLLAISLCLNILLGYFFFNKPTPPQNLFHVVRVIDGDTIVVDNNQQVRLMSVNAPEIELCGGQKSKEYLQNLIEGRDVRLDGQLNDHFGRLLALVYLNDKLVNQQIISAGWARFTSTASVESENLKSAFARAKEEKVGIFGPLCLQSENPTNPKCNIKGNVREGKKTYFYPGCGNYSNVALELDQGDAWFCTESEAVKAGFTRSANCH